MTLAEIKQLIFQDSNATISFNDQLDLAKQPTGWKDYFYDNLRVRLLIHNDVFNAIVDANNAGLPLTNLSVKIKEKISKEKQEPYKEFTIIKYTPAQHTL